MIEPILLVVVFGLQSEKNLSKNTCHDREFVSPSVGANTYSRHINGAHTTHGGPQPNTRKTTVIRNNAPINK